MGQKHTTVHLSALRKNFFLLVTFGALYGIDLKLALKLTLVRKNLTASVQIASRIENAFDFQISQAMCF